MTKHRRQGKGVSPTSGETRETRRSTLTENFRDVKEKASLPDKLAETFRLSYCPSSPAFDVIFRECTLGVAYRRRKSKGKSGGKMAQSFLRRLRERAIRLPRIRVKIPWRTINSRQLVVILEGSRISARARKFS